MSDDVRALYLQHRAGQDKYTYFLLAAAASALAFSVHTTIGLALSWSMLPLAGAALAWGASFYFGCKNVSWVQTALSANISLLELGQGTHPRQPQHPHEVATAVSGVTKAINSNAAKAYFHATWQFRSLLIGGVLFIGWHVLEMYLRTNAV